MLKRIFLFACFLGVFFNGYSQQNAIDSSILVVKVKAIQGRGIATDPTQRLVQLTHAQKVKQLFTQDHQTARRGISPAPSRLAGIYKISLPTDASSGRILALLRAQSWVKYAEPYPRPVPLAIPNDPAASINKAQYAYLQKIAIYQAWDVEKGDSTKIIGVLDTGVDPDQPDLQGKIAYNTADPINGIDDDGNGLIDDYAGYDFADGDANTFPDIDPHGTFVSGMAAANTNNGIGIAGTGYYSKVFPVKIFRSSDDNFQNGFEAIAYAADMGCSVINLSWGNPGFYSQYVQDIIDYAAIDKDAVIVVAAGNTNADLDFYPASYNHVLSVGATDNQDNKAPWATYSKFIDMMAPGVQIYSTLNGDHYGYDSGSSYSCGLTSGVAALLRARYPDLKADQITALLKSTTDPIYNIGTNSQYAFHLGSGRLNAYRALTTQGRPFIEISDTSMQLSQGNRLYYGDTLSLQPTIINQLAPTNSVSVDLTVENSGVTLLENHFQLDALGRLEQKQLPLKFRAVLPEDFSPNSPVVLRWNFTAGSFSGYQYQEVYSAPDAFIFPLGQYDIFANSRGNLGWSRNYPFQVFGLQQNQETLLRHSGFLLMQDSSAISGNTYDSVFPAIFRQDLKIDKPLKRFATTENKAMASLSMVDSVHNIAISQKWYAWQKTNLDNILMSTLHVVNKGGQTYDSLALAYVTDWLTGDSALEKATWDKSRNLSYNYRASAGKYYGVVLFSQDSLWVASYNKNTQNGNTADLDTHFSDSLIYASWKHPENYEQAGSLGNGADILQAQGYVFHNLQPKEGRDVGFAIITANSLSALQADSQKADSLWQAQLSHPAIGKTEYVCQNTAVDLTAPATSWAVYKDAGASQLLDSGQVFHCPALSQDSAFYYKSWDANGYPSATQTLLIRVNDPIANFSVSSDTIFLSGGHEAKLLLYNKSRLYDSLYWDFGNGYGSLLTNPIAQFTSTGNYIITLHAMRQGQCESTATQTIHVLERAATPDLPDLVNLCAGEPLTLQASNADSIAVYGDAEKQSLLYAGPSFTSNPIFQDSLFYVTNRASANESLLKIVEVHVAKGSAALDWALDTTSTTSDISVKASNTSSYSTSQWYVNGQAQGADNALIFSISDTTDLTLAVQTPSGCTFSKAAKLRPKESPSPTWASDTIVCPGEPLDIKPGNGHYFYFFADANRDSLLHKGTHFSFSPKALMTKLYVFGVDSLGFSQPLTVAIHSEAEKLRFALSSDTLDLATDETITAQLMDANNTAAWYLDGELLGNGNSQEIQTNRIGKHLLTATTTSGCIASYSGTFQVVNSRVTGLETAKETKVLLYPNPANLQFHIQVPSGQHTLTVYDARGKQILRQKLSEKATLQTQHWPSGLYWIQINNVDYIFTKKIIIQH